MASSFKLVFAVCLLLQLLDLCRGKVGVCYGRDGNNLPPPDQVATLVQNHNIQYVKIYDYNTQVLKAFANTGVELTVGVHNEELQNFQDPSSVDSWLQQNILPNYRDPKITDITVGNEVDQLDMNIANLALQAMGNVVAALKKFNLQDEIKVSTALSFGVISTSFPPSAATFSSSHTDFIIRLLNFIDENQSPFLINIYPYYTIKDDPSLAFALFKPSTNEFVDQKTGLRYTNMFDAQADAVHFAIENLKPRTTRNTSDAKLDASNRGGGTKYPETGYRAPGKGGSRRNHAALEMHDGVLDAEPYEKYSTIENALTYNSNLIRHATSGSGTPARPGEDLDVYIFSLFDENMKPSQDGGWGIFNPDMTSKYNLEFPGKGTNPNGRTWCIASNHASNPDLQKSLDFACGQGHADCSPIQTGQPCSEPNTLVSRASFAFNNYYQNNGATDESCKFGGAGAKVYADPSYRNCKYYWNPDNSGKGTKPTGKTWCIASYHASDPELKKALDFACGPGKADCSSIQPGQPCSEPNTVFSRASFAFNNYYQTHGATDESCKFGGAGAKVYADPSYGNCKYN